MKEEKISYETPVTTFVEIKQEGVICASPVVPQYNPPFNPEKSW